MAERVVDRWTDGLVASERLARQAALAEASGDAPSASGLYAAAACRAEAALGSMAACGPGLYAETLVRAAWLWLRAGDHGRLFDLVGSAFRSPAMPAYARSLLREHLMRTVPSGTMH